jgi:prepilin-type N-terminal cleavage/methylation domain-containing protein
MNKIPDSRFQIPDSSGSRRGFTLIELLVAISLFAVAVSIAVGGFTRALRTQRQLISLISANSNASLAIEQIAREMRTGSAFQCLNGILDCDVIAFTNAAGERVTYAQDEVSNALTRAAGNGAAEPITAANVRIENLSFLLFQGAGTYPSRITITTSVGVNDAELAGNMTNLQTTVSARGL